MESHDGKESDEDMYLHLTAAHPDQIEKGVKLCMDLVKTVKLEYDKFIEMKKAYKPELYSYPTMGGLPPTGGMPFMPPGSLPPGLPGAMPPGPPGMSFYPPPPPPRY